MAARLRDRRMAKDSPLADARADRSPVSAMGGAQGSKKSSGFSPLGMAVAPLTYGPAKAFKKLFG